MAANSDFFKRARAVDIAGIWGISCGFAFGTPLGSPMRMLDSAVQVGGPAGRDPADPPQRHRLPTRRPDVTGPDRSRCPHSAGARRDVRGAWLPVGRTLAVRHDGSRAAPRGRHTT